MSNTSNNEREVKKYLIKKEEKMYLNKGLIYKEVLDCNGKELAHRFFKSNQPETKPVGQTQTSKKIIKNIFHSLIELNKMIEVSHYPTLLSFGMGLATIDGETIQDLRQMCLSYKLHTIVLLECNTSLDRKTLIQI